MFKEVRSRGREFDAATVPSKQRYAQNIFKSPQASAHGRLRHAEHLRGVIAQGLTGDTRVPTGAAWKTHDIRDRTIRLCRRGLELMRGGYLDLLRHWPKHRG